MPLDDAMLSDYLLQDKKLGVPEIYYLDKAPQEIYKMGEGNYQIHIMNKGKK